MNPRSPKIFSQGGYYSFYVYHPNHPDQADHPDHPDHPDQADHPKSTKKVPLSTVKYRKVPKKYRSTAVPVPVT